MYWLIALGSVATLTGAVIYEIHRQKQVWKRFNQSLEQFECANSEPCAL